MIQVSTALSTALNSDNFEYAYLVDLPVGLHYTNHEKDLVVGGRTYNSNGLLVKFSNVKQNQELSLDSYSIDVSNVDNTLAKAYASGNYRGIESIIYIAVMSNGVVLGEPLILYKGTLDSFSIRESQNNSTLSLKLTSHWASYNQKAGRYTSDSLQQDLYPGDRIFKYAHVEQNNLGWGKRT